MRKAILLAVLGTLMTPFSFAATINLYEQPQANAKVVAKVDLSKGVIPIYTPKPGTWVKVANPQDGTVGWVYARDLNSNPSTITFSQKIISTGKAPTSVQFVEVNAPTLTDKEVQESMKLMEQRREALQRSTQKLFQDMMSDMSLFEQSAFYSHFPMIVPVVVYPAPAKPASVKPAPATNSAKPLAEK